MRSIVLLLFVVSTVRASAGITRSPDVGGLNVAVDHYTNLTATTTCGIPPEVKPIVTVGVPWSATEEEVFVKRAIDDVNTRVARWNERVVQFAKKRHASIPAHTAEKATLSAEGERLQDESFELIRRSARLLLRKENSY